MLNSKIQAVRQKYHLESPLNLLAFEMQNTNKKMQNKTQSNADNQSIKDLQEEFNEDGI